MSAHGNSLRAIVKYLDNIPDSEIPELNIPTGQYKLMSIHTFFPFSIIFKFWGKINKCVEIKIQMSCRNLIKSQLNEFKGRTGEPYMRY